MSWNSLPPDIRKLACEILTPKQQEAFQLELAGYGIMRIAANLGITKGAARERLHNTHKNLLNAGVRQDEFGRWTIERTEAA